MLSKVVVSLRETKLISRSEMIALPNSSQEKQLSHVCIS